MIKTGQQKAMEQLNLFDDILVQSVNVDILEQIDSLADYRGDAYMQVKEPLDKLSAMTYNSNNYYYYIVYVTDGKTIYSVMDYEDTLTARHPMYAYGTPGYTDALTEGTAQVLFAALFAFMGGFITRRMGVKKILLAGFLLLALLPFLLALSYREYFIPLYAAEMGISETMIGRIYLGCGLLIIYAGPTLTEKLISRLGGKWTVALASLFICLAPILLYLKRLGKMRDQRHLKVS